MEIQQQTSSLTGLELMSNINPREMLSNSVDLTISVLIRIQ